MSDVVSPALRELYDPRSHAFEWIRDTTSIVKAVNAMAAIVSSGYGGGAAAVGWVLRTLTITPTVSDTGMAAAGVGAIAWPVLVAGAAVAGEFTALGGGYQQAARRIAEEASKRGYGYGIMLGAMHERWPLVRSLLMWYAPRNVVFEAGGKIEQNHYNAGLLLGYRDGIALDSDQRETIFEKMAAAGGPIAGGGPRGDIPNRSFYEYASGRFRRVFLP